MRKLLLILVGIVIFSLSACSKEIEYTNDYEIENLEFFRIHRNDMFPVFMDSDGEIFLLLSNLTELYVGNHGTRIAVLFGNHDSKDDSFTELNYLNITDDIGLKEGEEVIEIIDYFEGWLFLTNTGNVYKFELFDDASMTSEYYVAGENNLINLNTNEIITNIYWRDGFQVDVLRFETSESRYFDFYKDTLHSIFGYELYDNTIFEDGENHYITLLDYGNESYIIVTDKERLLRYDTITKTVLDISENFSLEEGEKIIAFNYESLTEKMYVTNFGKIVSVNLNDNTVHQEFKLNIELKENEEIIDYQRGYYACKEGMVLIQTSEGTYYYLDGINKEAFTLDESIVPLEENDSIKSIKMSHFATNVCGTSSGIIYNGEEIYDFNFILVVETEYNHVYMLGAVSKYNKEELGEFIVINIF